MRAIVCTDYGPPEVLQLRDVPKPVPKDDEVLVRIRATTVSAADCELRRFDFAPWIWVPMRLSFGIRRPRRHVLGQELAGDVESVGKKVGSLQEGRPGLRGDGHPPGSLRGVHLPARQPPDRGDRDDAGEPGLRGGCGRPLRGRRGPGVPAEGGRPERTEGPGQRRGRELRHIRGPARQAPRGARDRGRQCAEAGDAAHDRRGSRHRLRRRRTSPPAPRPTTSSSTWSGAHPPLAWWGR